MSPSTKSRGARTVGRDTPGLLTYHEAAEYLNVSKAWLVRARNESRIPVQKVGRHVRFRQSDLDAYLDANYEGGIAWEMQARR